MIAVKAVSNYTARTDDQIDVKEGQVFYVLSMTSDERKYYLSSSSRVPFSRLAKSGYAPVPLFVVIGDTLPPGVSSKVKMLISDSNAPKSGQKAGEKPQTRGQKSSRAAAAAHGASSQVDDRLGGIPAGTPDQEQRKGLSHNISAAARYWFGGIMGRPGREVGGRTVNGTVDAAGDGRPAADGAHAPFHAAQGHLPVPVANVQIVTYAKRRAGVIYRIKITLADGTELFVRRTYDDVQKLDAKIRQRFAEMPPLPAPSSAAAKVEDAAAAVKGKELNVYLQGVVRIHRHLASSGGLGLHEEIYGALGSPADAQDQTAQATAAAAAPGAGGKFGFAMPAGKRRRPSGDSAFASRTPSLKNSVQGDASQPAVPEDRQHYGVVNTASSGKQQHSTPPTVATAAAAAPESLSDDAAGGGFAAMMTRRLERLANLDRTSARA